MNKTYNHKGHSYEVIEKEIVYLKNDQEQLDNYVDRLLKTYIISFKYERLNMCMFKRNYHNCSQKQLDYLANMLYYKFDYELSDKQSKFLARCSINEMSILISRIKNMEVELLDEHDFERDTQGNIVY